MMMMMLIMMELTLVRPVVSVAVRIGGKLLLLLLEKLLLLLLRVELTVVDKLLLLLLLHVSVWVETRRWRHIHLNDRMIGGLLLLMHVS